MHIPLRASLLAAAGAASLLAAGFVGGWWFGDELIGPGPAPPEWSRQIREPGYRFISPLLECETGPGTAGQHRLQAIDSVVEDLIASRIREGMVSHVSVYFRDLNNGPWFGVNETAEYSPASLLKVVIMIASLKQEERAPGFLKERLLYPKDADDQNRYESIRPTAPMVPGSSYRVEELVDRMIQQSDNNALQMLTGRLNPVLVGETYADLGIPTPETTGKLEDFVSVRAYASTFRVLFNASYLSRDHSEQALAIMSGTVFRQGLVAGVPPGTVVAHKFGERALGKRQEVKQLHDCGIIYHPVRPYLLCVMTRGSSFGNLTDAIRDVSRTVYEEVSERMGPQ
jgi:beta-lactamase class A